MERSRRPIPYHLTERIRHDIITGRYPPGHRLGEEAIEAECGASRGPIREALRLLELRGLVVHAPRRGFRVRVFTSKAVEDLYRLRALLERQSIDSLRSKDLSVLIVDLEASNMRMQRHFDAGDVKGYLHENIAFHRSILEYGGNEALQRTLEVLNEMAEPLRYRLLRQHLRKSRSVSDHKRITGLLREGRLDAAAAATESHILEGLSAVLGVVGDS